MPSISSNRPVIESRFPVLGFTVSTGQSPSWFQVVLATEPGLLRPEAKARRTRQTFFASGAQPAPRGEAVYLVPSEALARFVGQPRLYYTLAVSSTPDLSNPRLLELPPEALPAVTISKSFTGQMRRQAILSRNGGLTGYGESTPAGVGWAGDQPRPGTTNGVNNAARAPAASPPAQAPAPSTSQGADVAYDDGFGDAFWHQASAKMTDEDATDGPGIEGPIPDAPPIAMARALSAPEYPQASRFVPAAATNYRVSSGQRAINRIVIHITDGGANINGPVSWFQNPQAKVSAHYVVGQDGEVVQMVAHNDVAWHAGGANGDSIGIEHVANTRGLAPTDAEYCASAALVSWLCEQYGIPTDRQHVLGHSEADPKTTHTACPNAVWDWDYFMGMVESGSCSPRAAAAQALSAGGRRRSAARALTIVEPAYAPDDPQQALQFMREWQERKQRWRAGVPNTTFFPHSAICQFRIAKADGRVGVGTGFYIAPDRILTCAHNVFGATSLKVFPGKNGTSEPFGSFPVSASAWQIHPNYDPSSRDFDLAVIVVDHPPPNGEYFDVLEELRQSLPSAILVCGYAGKSVDHDVQHLDGDSIREVGEETFQYNLQTEPGNSGSPVFYVWGREDEERQMSVLETHLVGVHVSSFSGTLNQGCRLTDAKIAWIRSVGNATSSGLGRQAARALALAPLSGGDVQRMKATFVANASAAAKQNCITITNAGLRQLYGARLQNQDGTAKALSSTIQDTMAALEGYGLAQAAQTFEFNDAGGRLTKGVARPDRLRDSVEASLLRQAEANGMSAWYVFGLSLMDGYHSVVLALDFSGTGDPATKLYWADQIYSGWDDVTGTLDDRITRLIQRWWDAQGATHKPKTRVTVWPLNP